MTNIQLQRARIKRLNRLDNLVKLRLQLEENKSVVCLRVGKGPNDWEQQGIDDDIVQALKIGLNDLIKQKASYIG